MGRRTKLTTWVMLLAATSCLGNNGSIGGSQLQGQAQSPFQAEIAVTPVVLHRLSNLEYANSVRDAIGVALPASVSLPADVLTAGFDNVAANMTVGTTLMSAYSQAATAIAQAAFTPTPSSSQTFRPVDYGKASDGEPFGDAWTLEAGPLVVPFSQDTNDTVTCFVVAFGNAANADTPQMAVSLDGNVLQSWTVTAVSTDPVTYSVSAPVTAGQHTLTVTFTNRVAPNAVTTFFNTLVVSQLGVTSTTINKPIAYSTIYHCQASGLDPNTCAVSDALALTSALWRRPLTTNETQSITGMMQASLKTGTTDQAFEQLVQALLLSSKFLFRASPARDNQDGTGVPLDDYALASRLSYFLWASQPDAALLQSAAAGTLRSDDGLRDTVQRMLKDPRAQGFLDGFAAQWLGTRQLAQVKPDATLFPAWTPAIGDAMGAEAKGVFADFLTNRRPIADLMTPGFTFVNDTLATYYGLTPPNSATAVRVVQDDRGGLLTQGAWLVTNASSTRTSPVRRGLWVLEQMMCSTVPPPPAGVSQLGAGADDGTKTVRQLTELHVANPKCAACHNNFDPMGYSVENFDAIGRFHTQDANQVIDASGTLPSGQHFTDAKGLAQVLHDGTVFSSCLVQKLYSYALGRIVDSTDTATLTVLNQTLSTNGGSLDELLVLIVQTPQFRLVNTKGP